MESTEPRGDDADISFITSNKPHFFKIIVHKTIREGKLAMPKKFVKKYGSELSNSVSLRVPSGRVWAFELSKHNDDVWLRNGWQEFADYYSLNYGHLLVFEYQGCSRFHVLLFDKSATEINYQSRYIVRNMEPTSNPELKEPEDNDSVEILDGFGISHRTRGGSPFPHLGSKRKMRNEPTSPMEGSSMPRPLFRQNVGAGSSTVLRSQKAGIARREWSLTTKKNVKDFQGTSAFKSENPCLKWVMQPSYVRNNSTLTVPKEFAAKCTRGKRLDMMLIVADKSWPVVLLNYKSRSSSITRGWSAFAKENALRVGDVCVFELVNTEIDALKVSIFRHAG